MSATVAIRPLQAQDAPQVARLWKESLTQTVDAICSTGIASLFRPFVASKMERYANEAMQEDGDVGPQGKNLLNHWAPSSSSSSSPSGDDSQRCMFVAVLSEDPERCVGCVGVQRGLKKSEDDESNDDSSFIASISRLSVDSSVRRRGLGKQLMHAAETWAQSNSCTTVELWTANPIAQQFYLQQGYDHVDTFQKPGFEGFLDRLMSASLNKYSKPL